MIKRILLGLAGTPFSHAAIRQAVDVASQCQGEVTAVTIVDIRRLAAIAALHGGPQMFGREAQRVAVSRSALEEALRLFESSCRAAKVAYSIREEQGEPFTQLLRAVRFHDMVVFGLRSLFEYELRVEPRDALVELVSSGVQPLLAMSQAYRPIERVLVAYNGSHESAKAMKRFVQSGLWPQAAVGLVTFEAEPSERGQQLLDDAADYCQAHGRTPTQHLIRGVPETALLPFATGWQADMIVMGGSGRRALLSRLMGETTLHAVQHADRPLFLSQ